MSIDTLANEAFEVASNTVRPPETPHDTDLAIFVSIRNVDGDQLKRDGRGLTNVPQSACEDRC